MVKTGDVKMNWRNDKPTYKQLNFIKELEDEFGCKFVGTTKGEATDFISKWAKQYDDKKWDEHAEAEGNFINVWGEQM